MKNSDWKTNKKNFLKKDFPNLLREYGSPELLPRWGKFSFQGMVEHMSESVAMGYGKILFPVQVKEEDIIEKLRVFMLSNKVFRPNTPNSLIGENPPPLRFSSWNDSLLELEKHVSDFFLFFENHPQSIVINPFFGPLGAEEWTHLLSKHAWHHLNQFGIVNDPEYDSYLRNSAH